MFKLPAICDNCNTVFPSGFGMGAGATMFSMNNKSGPCPKCGGIGSLPNGIYEVIDEVKLILKVDNGKDAYLLQRILTTTTNKDTPKTIKNKITKEVPQYKGIAKIIDKFCKENKNTIAALVAFSHIFANISGSFDASPINTEKGNSNTQYEIIKENTEVIKAQRNMINDYKEEKKVDSEKRDN